MCRVDVRKQSLRPERRIALTLAKKLNGVVITASPGPTLPQPETAKLHPFRSRSRLHEGALQAFAAAASKLATCGPRMNRCEAQTSSIAPSNSLAELRELTGKIKHLNGLRVGYWHICSWYTPVEYKIADSPSSARSSSNHSGIGSTRTEHAGGCGLIIVVDARIVDRLGFRSLASRLDFF